MKLIEVSSHGPTTIILPYSYGLFSRPSIPTAVPFRRLSRYLDYQSFAASIIKLRRSIHMY